MRIHQVCLFSLWLSLLSFQLGLCQSTIVKGQTDSTSSLLKHDNENTLTSFPSSLLWKLEGEGLTTPSYIFGTIHLIPKDSFLLFNALEEAIEKADQLVLEIEMDTASLMASASSMMLPPDKTLNKLLPEEDFDLLKNFISDSLSLPIPMFQMIKPIFLTQHIATSYCVEGDQMVYELFLSEQFKEQNKPVVGLENGR